MPASAGGEARVERAQGALLHPPPEICLGDGEGGFDDPALVRLP